MPTRRDFLQSALLLPAALTTGKAFVQDTPKTNAAPTTEVFADFESGNYDGWTIEGDAFGTAPATDATFTGKIRGYTGRSFLCSLHPKKGNAAIGKAISKEFTIEKPFLTFKIGGGNHPNQACLNLIVDNKIVRTATGNGTVTLSESSFDVSEFVGKKAHIEIVDATASADRGYIMVDDIRFTDQNPAFPPIDFNNLSYQGMVTEMAERWRRDFGLPGVWCAFIKDGRVQACVASGTRKVGANMPARVSDHLNIGSVSKVVTGSLIAFFVADGTIKYETTVGEIFPELAKQYPQSPLLRATLRELITHTTGLTGGPAYGTDKSGGVAWRYGQLQRTLPLPQLREPGSVYEYSNVGAVIAAAMVERLSKTSYESWLYGKLGKNIGLTNPQMLDYSIQPIVDDVFPHYINGKTATPNTAVRPDSWRFAPQGSLRLILPDLCAFAICTMNNSAQLPETIYQRIISEQSPSHTTYAGWAVDTGGWLHHSGSTGRGEYCLVSLNPKTKRALLLYVNAGYAPSDTPRINSGMSPLLDDLHRLEVSTR